MSAEFLLGREPILDHDEKLYAYRLVYHPVKSSERSGDRDRVFSFPDVIIAALSDPGEFLGEGKGVLTIGFDGLMHDMLAVLPANRIILALDQELPLTHEVLERCHCLKESGFTLALGNHRFRQDFTDLYALVDIIGIDVTQTSVDQLKIVADPFRCYPARLLAENVLRRENFVHCQNAGFNYFQGFFFTGTTVTAKKKLNETAATLLRIALLIINEAEVESIVRTVQESPALTYKLLLQANSAVVGARREIDSVRHAILLLGRDQVRRWAQAELLAANGSEERDNPLVEMATIRAGFMEQLSRLHPLLRDSRDAADRAFLIGTLSMLEAIYSVSLEDVVASVELSTDVVVALLGRIGLLGDMLTFVEALERLDFTVAQAMLTRIELSPMQILAAQRKAFVRKSVMS